jgi:hypothetical protein
MIELTIENTKKDMRIEMIKNIYQKDMKKEIEIKEIENIEIMIMMKENQ